MQSYFCLRMLFVRIMHILEINFRYCMSNMALEGHSCSIGAHSASIEGKRFAIHPKRNTRGGDKEQKGNELRRLQMANQ